MERNEQGQTQMIHLVVHGSCCRCNGHIWALYQIVSGWEILTMGSCASRPSANHSYLSADHWWQCQVPFGDVLHTAHELGSLTATACTYRTSTWSSLKSVHIKVIHTWTRFMGTCQCRGSTWKCFRQSNEARFRAAYLWIKSNEPRINLSVLELFPKHYMKRWDSTSRSCMVQAMSTSKLQSYQEEMYR